MFKLTETKKYLLGLIILDLMIAILYFFIMNNFWNGRLAEIDDLNTKLDSLQQGSKAAATASRLLKETESSRDRINFYFINKDTTQNFIEELENSAKIIGVTIKIDALSVGKDSVINSPPYLRISFGSDGGFSEVMHFQKVIESLPYQIRINSFNIAKLSLSSWHSETSIDLLSYIDK